MSVIGIPLSTFVDELQLIPEGISPTCTIKRLKERLAPYGEEMANIKRSHGPHFDVYQNCCSLPGGFMATCTFEELSKLYAPNGIWVEPYREMFERDPKYRIIAKIKSSLWRYGSGVAEKEWNTLVMAYNGIRTFSLGLTDFEVTLNYTTGVSAYGRNVYYPECYLDAVFGFIVHYKGAPVMTIGFSFANGRKLLIAQIQAFKQKGNRFLYKLPADRTDFIVSLMCKFFPDFALYLVDGAKLVEEYVRQFTEAIEAEREDPKGSPGEILRHECKIAGYNGEVGEHIRRAYRLHGGSFTLSEEDTLEMHDRHFRRIVPL